MKRLLLALLLLTVIPSPADDRPNIIVILGDDMGFSDIGCFGGEVKTPNIDRLAKDGVRFNQFYNAARCCPTRASLLTGIYPHQAGVGMMVTPGKGPGYMGHLSDRCVTIAEVLKDGGYQTFMAGKWHVTLYDYSDEPELHRESWPKQRGFDGFFGTLAGSGSYFGPKTLLRDNDFIPPGESFYYTDAINNESAKFIAEADPKKPLFLYVSHVAPHWPLHALPEDIAKYEKTYQVGWDAIRAERHRKMVDLGLIDSEWSLSPRPAAIPAWEVAEHRDWEARRMAVYAAQIDRMDQGLSKITEALKKTGRSQNTLILFLSDNGGSNEVIQGEVTRHGNFARGGTRPEVMPGEPDTYSSYGSGWANASNTPFRFFKKWTHEGGIATPLVAHWPKRITAGGAIHRDPGHVIDIMATVVDASGVPYPSDFHGRKIVPLEGKSLLPAFEGKSIERDAIYWEHDGNKAVRAGKWKLMSEKGKPWELYDLEKDRTEMNDLAASEPDHVTELRAKWEAWAKRAMVTP